MPALLLALALAGCGSGVTLFEEGPTRIFLSDSGRAVYVCSARLQEPQAFADGGDELFAFRQAGRRVGFASRTVDAGWVDTTTAEVRTVHAGSAVQTDRQAVAVGADGSVAFLERSFEGQTIGYARNGPARLGRPRVLATVPAGDVVPESLAVMSGTVFWRTTSGVLAAAAVRRARE
jgi:hypothetical protein